MRFNLIINSLLQFSLKPLILALILGSFTMLPACVGKTSSASETSGAGSGAGSGGGTGVAGRAGGGSGGYTDDLVLPTGTVLSIPETADRSATYDCDSASILCVPSEYSTLQSAADATTPGDLVVVSSGNYNAFEINISGEENNPIKFIAEEGVIIDSFSGSEHGITIRSNFSSDYYVDYIHLIGFRIEGPPKRCLYSTSAKSTRPTRGHLIAENTCVDAGTEGFILSQITLSVVQDNYIFNAGNGSAKKENDHGIYFSNGGVGDSLVRRNLIMGSSTNGIHLNGDQFVSAGGGTDGIISGMIFDSNIIIGNGQNGFNMDGVQDTLIINNVFLGNSRHAVRGYMGDGAEGPESIVVINNTFIDGNSAVKLTDDSGAHKVFNNIFVDLNEDAIVVDSTDVISSNNQEDDAIVFQALPTVRETATTREIEAFDFSVITEFQSQMIDQGVSEISGDSAPAHDLNGEDRSDLPDLGAVEY